MPTREKPSEETMKRIAEEFEEIGLEVVRVDDKMEVLKEIAERSTGFLKGCSPRTPSARGEDVQVHAHIPLLPVFPGDPAFLSGRSNRGGKRGRNPLYEKYACMEGRMGIPEDKRG